MLQPAYWAPVSVYKVGIIVSPFEVVVNSVRVSTCQALWLLVQRLTHTASPWKKQQLLLKGTHAPKAVLLAYVHFQTQPFCWVSKLAVIRRSSDVEPWTNPVSLAAVRISTADEGLDEGLDEVTFRLLSNPKFMILGFQICSFRGSVRALGKEKKNILGSFYKALFLLSCVNFIWDLINWIWKHFPGESTQEEKSGGNIGQCFMPCCLTVREELFSPWPATHSLVTRLFLGRHRPHASTYEAVWMHAEHDGRSDLITANFTLHCPIM